MCEMCSFKTFSKSHLYFHHKRVHTEDGGLTHACEFCPKRFSTNYLRQRHQASHSSERNFVCEQCPARFATGFSLREHQRQHTRFFLYECKKCLQKFKNRAHTKRHILIHSDVPCYKCDSCDETFKNEPAGSTHSKVKHNNQARINLINQDYINELFETCVREIKEEIKEGNNQFKRMRGSNLAVAEKLASLVKD